MIGQLHKLLRPFMLRLFVEDEVLVTCEQIFVQLLLHGAHPDVQDRLSLGGQRGLNVRLGVWWLGSELA